MKTTAIMTALLALGLLMAAPTAAADPLGDADAAINDDCPAIRVETYAPYVSVHPECLTIPPFGET